MMYNDDITIGQKDEKERRKMQSMNSNSSSAISLQKIHDQWKKDCVIDDVNLDKTSTEIPLLHAKYLELYDHVRSKRKTKEYEFSFLYRDRVLWYEGKLDQKIIDQYQWKYDPYDGLLVKTKAQRDVFIKNDDVLLKEERVIDEYRQCEETLKEILENIRWRAQNIKNIIQWKMFQAGA